MKYISALDMHFRDSEKLTVNSEQVKKIFFELLLFTVYCLLSTVCYAEVLDRVAAIVDDEAIMLSELNEAYQKAVNVKTETTREEVLDGLINRVLILKQANRLRYSIQTSDDDNMLINEYIDKQLRTFIRIPVEDIEQYYEKNKQSLGNKDFYDVRDKIEEYLTEKELNKRLIKHIEELRKSAYIKIQVESEN